MNIHLNIAFTTNQSASSLPIFFTNECDFAALPLSDFSANWLKAQNFKAKSGAFALLPNEKGGLCGAVLISCPDNGAFITGKLADALPDGDWHFHDDQNLQPLHYLGLALGAYKFNRYLNQKSERALRFFVPSHIDYKALLSQAESTTLVRNLINTPTNDMGPDQLENIVRMLGNQFGASVHAIIGDDLLAQNFPLIHAVGRASAIAPRLIELNWGRQDAPKITLIGKGVCFDTGGLDIKPASGMFLMKKDMGGAANVIGLAQMIMEQKLDVRLKLLIPAVENSIAGNAFRPSDILMSRKGLSIEIGNTDAEGRLVLSDALAYGDEDAPDLIIDMATLTGAARVALGPDLPPFYSHDQNLVSAINAQSIAQHDPVWQLPLWPAYKKNLNSPIADLNNVTSDGFAGSITAALFLNQFVEQAKSWAHFDIYGWTPTARPSFPKGGEAQGIRALFAAIRQLYVK
ncbi:leucyl aminopeptidase family protein [Bartonella sp. HY329]|uniref:leucyl aminopeptidase family protein n=1 Tax=unclassified Bartonella TaxID=2645622 RepID=UPI0021C5B131|nr:MULTISPECIES: leucyl aminopeptidase family protein [unclassified Bartonella]UXM95645.1 leucyl aminopeptidase family protein [Bartonella sp. HY329]UXN09970.1 leucyl aminopeptidase family protein [Bartonella sp. HY328]